MGTITQKNNFLNGDDKMENDFILCGDDKRVLRAADNASRTINGDA
jgi:hypothetical protein